jgi:F0F1-type ATP synthase assembly protein I
MQPAQPDRRPVSPFAFAILGMEMAGFTVTGVLIDWLTGLMPWFTVAFTVLGVIAAFMHLARVVQRPSPKSEDGGK